MTKNSSILAASLLNVIYLKLSTEYPKPYGEKEYTECVKVVLSQWGALEQEITKIYELKKK